MSGRVGIRSFSSSGARWESAALPSSKPVGAFRGGYGNSPIFNDIKCQLITVSKVFLLISTSVFGFLAGSVAAGGLVYYYILTEYRLANETLSEDISVCV